MHVTWLGSELQRCASRCCDGLFVSINKPALFYFQPLIYLHLPHWKWCDPAQNNAWEISKTVSFSCIASNQLIRSIKSPFIVLFLSPPSTHSPSSNVVKLCRFREKFTVARFPWLAPFHILWRLLVLPSAYLFPNECVYLQFWLNCAFIYKVALEREFEFECC